MNFRHTRAYSLAYSIYKKLFFKSILEKQINTFNGFATVEEWIKAGRPSPPPAIFKRQLIGAVQKKTGIRNFIETGTFMGDTIMANLNNFDTIFSIEIEPSIFKKAKERFLDSKHVHIYQGHSINHLPDILSQKKGPAIYWLDSHFSGGVTGKADKDTPIMEELNLILKSFDHDVLLIDDARYFIGKDDYPTIEGLRNYIHAKNPDLKFEVTDDIILVTDKKDLQIGL